MVEETNWFHYQEYRSVAYDLLTSASEGSPRSAFGASIKGEAFTFLGVFDPASENMVRNGSFEDGWNGWSVATGEITEVDDAHSGRYVCRLDARDVNQYPRTEYFDTVPGKEYVMEFWIRRLPGGSSPGPIRGYSYQLKSDGTYTGMYARSASGSSTLAQGADLPEGEWVRLSGSIVAQSDVVKLNFAPHIASSGTGYEVDDFKAFDIDSTRIKISNPRNPSDNPTYLDLAPYIEPSGYTYFALTYSGDELSIRVEGNDGYPLESIPESFPLRIDVAAMDPLPYKKLLIYSANMSRLQIKTVWTLMHYELHDGDYRPYEWPESASQFALSVYNYLPEAFRTHDENDETTLARFPFLRYLEGALKYGSTANDFAEEVGENLFDPDNARDEWLRWVSQVLGLGTSKALTPSQIRERIRAIAEIGSPAVGTRPHIASVTRQYLTGYQSVFVIPSVANQWVINLILRTNEVPDEDTGRIVRGVMASGAVPAGHSVRVLFATTTWGAYDDAIAALGGTWDAHAGTVRTWADNDSIGTNLEETPDPEAPLPEE